MYLLCRHSIQWDNLFLVRGKMLARYQHSHCSLYFYSLFGSVKKLFLRQISNLEFAQKSCSLVCGSSLGIKRIFEVFLVDCITKYSNETHFPASQTSLKISRRTSKSAKSRNKVSWSRSARERVRLASLDPARR